MTDIIKLLEKTDQENYIHECYTELDSMLIERELPVRPDSIVANINATNILLIQVEDELKKQKLEQEFKMLELKNSEEYCLKYKTLKQREETAKLECKEYNTKILELEKKKQILQANKQGYELEYRSTLKLFELEFTGGNIETR